LAGEKRLDRISTHFFPALTARRPRVATEKTLIIGADTLADSNIATAWADRCAVAGVTSRRRFALDGCHVIVAAPNDRHALTDIIDAQMPKTIVVCGPASRSAWDWSHDFEAGNESEWMAITCRAASRCGSRLIVVSSDAACSGPFLFSRDDDDLSIDRAALSIRRIETVATDNQALAIRTHLFGWSPTADSWIEQIWTAIAEGRPVYAPGANYATPILASDFAELLWKAKTRNLHGLYNLAGAERASMWHFATVLSGFAGAALKVLSPDPASAVGDFGFNNQSILCQETSLDSRQIQRVLQVPLPRLQDAVARFVEQATSGYRDRITAALALPALAASAA
jgi:dTDP-4-dehydrorhamnose reductase